MKKFPREKYTLKAYENERYSLMITKDEQNMKTNKVEYSDNWEELYAKAKKESEKGNECEIWELKFEFFP